ncbi:MAG TPA: hypothetical protein VH834_25795 [Solirubrobacteraceae bacterium]
MTETTLKLRTWWQREELDERLAHGANPESDPMLSRRAAQLTARSTRTRTADALVDALDEARKAWSISARLPLRRAELRACAEDVVALADRLRDDRPIDTQGAAMSARLIFDGSSPVYREGAVTLRYALRSARLALDPIEAVIETELPRVA